MNKGAVHITPSVLKWARERAGYTQDEVVSRLKAKKIDVQALNKCEAEESQLSYAQLRKLAALYKRPIALFFFPAPPSEPSIESDFRSLPQEITSRIPPKIRYLVRKAKVNQMNLEELYGETAEQVPLFNLTSEGNATVITLAQHIRKKIDITIQQQIAWQDGDEALKEWRKAIEQTGIWVFKDNFGDNDYCGFCIYDKRFPIIYLNNNHSKERQIFTLFHELGHLLRGQAGIDFRISPELTGDYNRAEVFCNAFAGNFLLPSELLSDSQLPDDNTISEIAKQYKVSYDVVLRKYRDAGLISWYGYQERIDNRSSRATKTGLGGDYYLTQNAYLSSKYKNLVFKKYYRQEISEEQVADYLGVKVSSVPLL